MAQHDDDNNKNEILKYLKSVKSSSSDVIDIIFDDDDDKTYLGIMKKFERETNQFTTIVNLNRNKFTLSINAELHKSEIDINKKNDKIMSIDVEKCKLSTIRDKFSYIVNNIKNIPTKEDGYIYQATSVKELEIKSGIKFLNKDVLYFLTSVAFNRNGYKTNAVSIITVRHFVINVDHDQDLGAFSILKDDVSLSDIQNSISKNDIPLFVSSCKIGRQIIISIKTNLDYNQLEEELDINGTHFTDIRSFIQKLSITNRVNSSFYMRGGKCHSNINNDERVNQALTNLYDTNNDFGTILSYRLSNIYDNSPFNNTKIFKKYNNLDVIYVIPDSRFKKCIDFSFLHQYRSPEFSINLSYKKESEFKNLLSTNRNYLSTFDILLLGGVDGKDSYSIFNTDLVNIIDDWRKTRGFIIFMHDFITGKQKDLFEGIVSDLGFIDVIRTKSTFEKITMNENAPINLKKNPNTLFDSFQIAKTHESAKYSSDNVLIKDLNSEAHYLAQNLISRIADCSIGHNVNITENEQRLFVNILKNIALQLFDFPSSNQEPPEKTSDNDQQENPSNANQHPINSSNNTDQREGRQINQPRNNNSQNDNEVGIDGNTDFEEFDDNPEV